MFGIISRKGIIETEYHVSLLLIVRGLSIIRSMLLKLRGYGIQADTIIPGGNVFFQSHMHHISVGKMVRFGRNTRLDAGFGGRISVGNDVLIDDNCFITAQGTISIGNHVQISAYSFITDFNHAFSDKAETILKQGYEVANVVIGDDVWIGTHAVILPGVTVGKGSVVGAGSVVTRTIPPYSIAVGNPAKVIRTRK